MVSRLLPIALALTWVSVCTHAQAQGAYRSPIFASVKINGCTSGYLKNNSTSCVYPIPSADLELTAAVAADVKTGTDSAKYVTPAALSGSAAPQTLTDGATINWNAASGYNAKVTLGGNRTMAAMTNAVVGQTYTLQIVQDATGSRTITWNAAYTWGLAGAPTLTTTANRMDLVSCLCTAATPVFACSIAKGF